MRRLRTLLVSGAALIIVTNISWGQSKRPGQEVDLAVLYSAQQSNITPGKTFWAQGGAVELSAEAYHGLGIAMNITGQTADNLLSTGIDLNTVTSTFGPRYTWHRADGRIAVFGEGLIGESRAWNSLFPAAGGAVMEYNSFALRVGGGVDLRIARHLAVRPIQADWLRTQFPNATTNVQNSLRLGGGVVVRFR